MHQAAALRHRLRARQALPRILRLLEVAQSRLRRRRRRVQVRGGRRTRIDGLGRYQTTGGFKTAAAEILRAALGEKQLVQTAEAERTLLVRERRTGNC